LDSLNKCFGRMKHLNDVILNLEGCDGLTDKGICGLGEMLERNSVLKEVDLCVESCMKITEEGAEGFLKKLKRVNSLRKLHLACPFQVA